MKLIQVEDPCTCEILTAVFNLTTQRTHLIDYANHIVELPDAPWRKVQYRVGPDGEWLEQYTGLLMAHINSIYVSAWREFLSSETIKPFPKEK